jgi:hypothetical protein
LREGASRQNLRSLGASVEETKRMKPADQAIVGMVSESPGRNASEPSGGLDKMTPEAEPSLAGRRQHDRVWADRDSLTLRRGGYGWPIT